MAKPSTAAPVKQHHGRKYPGGKAITSGLILAGVAFAALAVYFNPEYVQDPQTIVRSVPGASPILNSLSAQFESVYAQFPESKQLWEMMPGFNFGGNSTSDDHPRPGLVLAAKGHKPKHPVVIIPGFVTSGLELWTGKACGKKYFRQRMWGTMTMMQLLIGDMACWFEHMALDPKSGLDPTGIKMRAAAGLEAVDYFVHGYWVWSKLVEALADVGYDPNNLVCEAYDWRLSIPNMEVRDGYFTRLRASVETVHTLSGHKAVLVSHSYGENVVRAFYAWIEEQAQPGWVEAHLEAHVAIAGVSLGIPKAITAILSGELRDTAQLGPLTGYLMNGFIPRQSRAKLWRTWGSLIAMMPVGGPRIWGNATWAPDDDEAVRRGKRTFGHIIAALPANKKVLDQKDLSSNNETGYVNAEDIPSNPSNSGTNGTAIQTGGQFGGAPDGDISKAASSNEGASSSSERGDNDSAMAGLSIPHSIKSWYSGGQETKKYDSSTAVLLNVHTVVDILNAVAGRFFKQNYKLAGPQGPPPIPTEELSEEVMETIGRHQAEQAATAGRPTGDQARALAFFPDATLMPLPDAPSLKTYCLYGVGLPTERAYHYLAPEAPGSGSQGGTRNNSASGNTSTAAGEAYPTEGGKGCSGGVNEDICTGVSAPEIMSTESSVLGTFDWRMNTAANDLESNLDRGVQMGPGDGTVPLISLGAMCRGGWLTRRLNPAGSRIVTHEFQHSPVSLLKDPRGGPLAADHVDILGNEAMLTDVVLVATGHGDEIETQIVSEIDEIAARINWD